MTPSPLVRRRCIAPWLVVLAALTACQTLREDEPVAEPADDHLIETTLGDMPNVSVCGDAWLGQTPRPEDLDIAHRRGVRTVISLLRDGNGAADEVEAACERLGLTFVRVDVDEDLPSADEIDRALAALDEPDRGPVLVFCESGARTAQVFAIWRVTRDGVPVAEALEAARRTGMKPGAPEDEVRRHVTRLLLDSNVPALR